MTARSFWTESLNSRRLCSELPSEPSNDDKLYVRPCPSKLLLPFMLTFSSAPALRPLQARSAVRAPHTAMRTHTQTT